MAMVRFTQGPSKGQRVAGAIQAFGQGISNAAKSYTDIQEAQQDYQAAQQQQEMNRVRLQETQQQMQDYYRGKVMDLVFRTNISDNPDKFMQVHGNDLDIWSAKAGTPELTRESVAIGAGAAGNAVKAASIQGRSALGQLLSTDVRTADPIKFQAVVEKAAGAFDTLINEAPNDLRNVYAENKKSYLNYAAKVQEQINSFQETKYRSDQARLTEGLKPPKPGNQIPESAFERGAGAKSGATYANTQELQPKIRATLSDIDALNKLADKVWTGPLVGKTLPYFLQKVGSKDAIAFEHLLQKQVVQLIMDFAKSAGVRAIDTEKEQERLFKAISNKEMDKDTLKKALLSMKSLSMQGQLEFEAQRKHLQGQKSRSEKTGLVDYVSPYENKQVFVSSKGDVKFLDPENDKVPSGYVTREEMWGGTAEAKPVPITNDAIDAAFGR